MKEKPIGYDLSTPAADGSDDMTIYIINFLNTYPKLEGEEVRFQRVGQENISMVPLGNASILSNKVSITNHVRQKCQYSFQLFRKSVGLSENMQIKYKEFLDNFAMWLQMQEYPQEGLPEGVEITSMLPGAAAALYVREDNQSEAWMIPIDVKYTREFDK